MENSQTRLGLVVAAFVVGGAIGYFIGRAGGGGTTYPPTIMTPTAPTTTASTATAVPGATLCLTPGPQVVTVGADGALSCPEARIRANQKDNVQWQTTPGLSLWIRFPNATPFPQLNCADNGCNSHAPATGSGTSNGTPTISYDYNVNVFGRGTPTPGPGTPTPTPQATNGRIIIIKP